jgi:hypothetical protein
MRSRILALQAPLKPTPYVLRTLAWPPPAGLSGGGADEVTALAFTPDGDFLAAGSRQGRLAVFSLDTGAPAWKVDRPGRVIKHLAFSADGVRLYVGEQGPEGRLAAYDWRAGGRRPLWFLDSARDLGASPPSDPDDPYAWVTWPGVYRLVALGEDLLAVCSHSWRQDGAPQARARVYRLDGRTGAVRWSYPAGGAEPMMMTWFAETGGGRWVAVPLQLPAGAAPAPGGSQDSRVVLLEGSTGRPLAGLVIPAVAPYRVAGFWRGLGLAPDGRSLALSTEDGRGFLFGEEGARWAQRKALELVRPIVLGGVTVAATSGTLVSTAREVIFATGPSYVPMALGGAEQTPPRHPQGNTLFAFDWAGTPRWLWRLDNDLQGASLGDDRSLLALLEGADGPQTAEAFNGLAVLELSRPGTGRDKLAYRFPVPGRVVYDGLALSPDGRWMALAEAPRRLKGDPRTLGGNRVVVLR